MTGAAMSGTHTGSKWIDLRVVFWMFRDEV